MAMATRLKITGRISTDQSRLPPSMFWARAAQMLKAMKFRGRVCIPRTRRVEGQNKPVAEYSLPVDQGAANDAVMNLSTAMRVWG